jgi:transcriptional regulator with XRE-family HTH domain
MDIERQIAARLRSRRRLLGLTLEEVANRCGSSFQTVQKYEAGKVRISASTLWELSRALEIDVAYFFWDARGEDVGPADLDHRPNGTTRLRGEPRPVRSESEAGV